STRVWLHNRMICGHGAHLLEEGAAVLQCSDQIIVGRDRDTGDILQLLHLIKPTGGGNSEHGVRPETGYDLAAPPRCANGRVMLEFVRCSVRSRQDLDVEPIEQHPGQKIRRLKLL